MVAGNIRHAQLKAIGVLFVLAALVLGGALICAGCTYNTIQFETDCFRFTDTIKVEPGQGGDSSDTGSTADGAGVGGAGKLSPGGSNLLDGSYQFAVIVQQGGETPSQTTPTVTVDMPSPITP